MKRIKGTRKRNLRRLRGVVLAEAAIVLTVLLMVTLGALQYGWFFYCLHTATNAARQGARVACVLDANEADGTTALGYALGGYLLTLSSPPTEVTPTTITVGVDSEGADITKAAMRGEVFIASAKVALLPGIPWLPVPDCHARVTMAKEGN